MITKNQKNTLAYSEANHMKKTEFSFYHKQYLMCLNNFMQIPCRFWRFLHSIFLHRISVRQNYINIKSSVRLLRGTSERIKSTPEALTDFWVYQSLHCLELSTLVSKQ